VREEPHQVPREQAFVCEAVVVTWETIAQPLVETYARGSKLFVNCSCLRGKTRIER